MNNKIQKRNTISDFQDHEAHDKNYVERRSSYNKRRDGVWKSETHVYTGAFAAAQAISENDNNASSFYHHFRLRKQLYSFVGLFDFVEDCLLPTLLRICLNL